MATDFRDLRVWEESMALAEAVYKLAGRFPVDERYGLIAQIKRAVVSVPVLDRARSVSLLLQALRKALSSKLLSPDHSPFPIPHSPL